MKNIRIRDMKGFTLVELLIVITLIAILSVAVLATINPIEQTNKAKDASIQNDAAEILNAYERYYANTQHYPWEGFVAAPPVTIDSEIFLPSTSGGFGICYTDKATATAATEVAPGTPCLDTAAGTVGGLIHTDELKPSFANKTPFRTHAAAPVPESERLWTIKSLGSNGALSVCFIPRSKSSRQNTTILKCVNSTATNVGVANIGVGCTNIDPATGDWSTALLDGTTAMFRCVPE